MRPIAPLGRIAGVAGVPEPRCGYSPAMATDGTSRTRTFKRRSAVAAVSTRRTLARAVGVLAAVVALVLIAGIALVLLKANESNAIVGAVRDAASWLAGPFDRMFTLDRRRTEIAVNWGIAAVVWFALGRLLARVIAP